jgi:nickel-dependent lactate racemase
MSLNLSHGNEQTEISDSELRALLFAALDKLGPRSRVLVVPPDITRLHSRAGELTRYAFEYYGDRLAAVLPALGTHAAMSPEQLTRMFGDVPQNLFHVHNWRTDIETIGEVPSSFIHEQSEGKLNLSWPAQINRLLL